MTKNKKKKAQMFRNFLAFKAGQGNANQPSSFQTPHSDQEKLTELIDDNVGGGPNQPTEMNKASGSGTNTNATQKINNWTALKPVENSSYVQVNMRQDPKHPNLTIVEGSASKIQLVIDKSKKVTPQPSNVDEPTSNTSRESVRTNSSLQTSEQTMQNQPIHAFNPTQAAVPTQPSNLSKYPYTPQKISSLPPFSYPAGIPRSLYTHFAEPNNKGKSNLTTIPLTPVEKSPSPQANPQGEKKNAPNWVVAPHAKPVWQTQQSLRQPNQGSGWPKTRSTATGKYDGYLVGAGSGGPAPTPVPGPVPAPVYSPSDIYCEVVCNEERATDDETESSETLQAGSKRLSAFQRLGPVAEQPKKPKLTINLLCEKDVRNVVDETDEVPTHLRGCIVTSTDELVLKYRPLWPFQRTLAPTRTATLRLSKSVMMLETEYMEEAYARDNRFILVAVTGYPTHWKKEDVLDVVLDSVKGKSFIPCFIEFSRVQCRFLVIRCRLALLAIHKYGFVIRKDDVELILSLSNIHLNLNQLDFVPRLILRKLLSNRLNGDSLDLSNFTTENDISHFVYFPLHRVTNQTELIQLQSTVPWDSLTSLDLSHNRITTVVGLRLCETAPRLRRLDLGYNSIGRVTALLPDRILPLCSLRLEGNPLCHHYIQQEHYIKVLTAMFSGLLEIDGVPIKQLHDLPDAKRNYCPEDAKHIVDKVLEVMFPLLDAPQEQRYLIQELYDEDAVLTITFMYKLRYSAVYKEHRSLFTRAREQAPDDTCGAGAIAAVLARWPRTRHDPATFTLDVLCHTDSTTIVRIGGILKITSESLADDEHLLSFTRTLVLHTKDGCRYKITNEMLFWDLPEKEYAETSFKITRIKPENLNLRLDAPPDEDLKEQLLNVFMQITELPKRPSERCLEEKEWNIRNALEYFTKLLKMDNLQPIMRDS